MNFFPFSALLFVCCTHLVAADTNKFFITIDDEDRDVSDHTNGLNEYLPAEQFLAGNWGQSTNDIQVSLRFEKSCYTNGEPITAIILVRNVTNKTVDYHNIYVDGFDGPVRFFVTSADNCKVEGIQWGDVSAKSADVIVGSQRKFLERFDREFHLTNGTYFIQAYVMPGSRRVYAESARVPITIKSTSGGQ